MTKPKILSAGVVIVRREGGVYRFLLLRAYNYWDFPKGIVETGETPLETACREAEEETGITGLDFAWGHKYRETAPYGAGKVARYYLAKTAQERVCLSVNPELGRPEHHEFQWMEAAQARELLVERLQAILDWAEQHLRSGDKTAHLS